MGTWLTARNTCTLPHFLPCRVCSFSVKWCYCKYEDLSENFDPSRPAFQGHSKVIGTDTDRSAACIFQLAFHRKQKHWPISYCFRDKQRYKSDIGNFSHPGIFNAPASGIAWVTLNSVKHVELHVASMGGSTLGPGGHSPPPKCWPSPPNILVPTAKYIC